MWGLHTISHKAFFTNHIWLLFSTLQTVVVRSKVATSVVSGVVSKEYTFPSFSPGSPGFRCALVFYVRLHHCCGELLYRLVSSLRKRRLVFCRRWKTSSQLSCEIIGVDIAIDSMRMFTKSRLWVLLLARLIWWGTPIVFVTRYYISATGEAGGGTGRGDFVVFCVPQVSSCSASSFEEEEEGGALTHDVMFPPKRPRCCPPTPPSQEAEEEVLTGVASEAGTHSTCLGIVPPGHFGNPNVCRPGAYNSFGLTTPTSGGKGLFVCFPRLGNLVG